MSFRYQLNYFKDEDGEYTEPTSLDPSELRELISQNWPNEGYVNELKIIHITDDNNQHLILKNCKRGVFEVYFYRESERHHFHKKSRLELVINCNDLFVNQKFSQLESELNRTTKDRKYLRTELVQNHFYELLKSRTMKEFRSILMGVILGIVLIVVTASNIGFAIIMFPFAVYFMVMGPLIHYLFYRDNKDLKIYLTRGNDRIKVVYNGQEFELQKSDIESATQHEAILTTWMNRSFWLEYGYTRLKLKSGGDIFLTSLLIDPLTIADKFKYSDVPFTMVTDYHPLLWDRTTIKR